MATTTGKDLVLAYELSNLCRKEWRLLIIHSYDCKA